MEPKVQTVNLNIKNKKQDVILDKHVDQLNIATYWDSHGQKIPFPGRNNKNTERIRDCNVKIIRSTYDIVWDPTKTSSYEDWLLEVDDKKIPGDVLSFGGSTASLRIKLCVGEG